MWGDIFLAICIAAVVTNAALTAFTMDVLDRSAAVVAAVAIAVC